METQIYIGPFHHSLVLSVMEKNITGVGPLTKHHIFYVMAIIGLIPPCSLAYAKFGSAAATLNEQYSKFIGSQKLN